MSKDGCFHIHFLVNFHVCKPVGSWKKFAESRQKSLGIYHKSLEFLISCKIWLKKFESTKKEEENRVLNATLEFFRNIYMSIIMNQWKKS